MGRAEFRTVVVTSLQQLADDVGTQLGTLRDLSLPLGDEDPEVFGHLGETLLQLLASLDPRLELLKDPIPEPIAIAVWYAQQQGNDADGNVLGVVESRVASAVVRARMASISSLQISRVRGTSRSTAVGVKAGRRARLAFWWRGGSLVIGGALPPRAGTKSRTIT